jgi:OOP family OmpA-OmpF porin
MKKEILLMVFALSSLTATKAQDNTTTDAEVDQYNKWSFEVNVGQSKGIKPYTEGYYANNPNKFMGGFAVNHFSGGVRYMFSPKFGLKVDFGYDKLEDLSNSGSLDFEMRQMRLGFQGVINAARLFDIQDKLGNFSLLFHGGFQVAQNAPQKGPFEGHDEYNGGLMFGFTPEFRITKNLAVNLDFTINSNVRQHYNWDGQNYSDSNNNLAGSLYTTSLGFSFSFGSEKIHGDWAVFEDKKAAELAALEKRVGEIEDNLVDSDKDGVPDYLDTEPNSIAGVAVDSRGRMVDLNNNGIPDELERYLEQTYSTKESSTEREVIKRLINEGYITTYFDTNKTKPTNVSTEGIDFMLTYLRNNPDASIDIIGNADEIGKNTYNDKLALERANSVKAILVKAGIEESRLNVISKGEDTSVDPASEGARKLVRRVVFKVRE